MAGQTLQRIWVSKTDISGLNIFVASTDLGLKRVGLYVGGQLDAQKFFSSLFPSATIVHAEGRNTLFENALRQSLLGRPWDPSLPIDINCTDFQLKVLDAISKIPFGKTLTYREVAEMVGKPQASRAVGQALKANPLPLVFP